MTWQLKDRFHSYIEPWEPLKYAVWAIWVSAKDTYYDGKYRDLLYLSGLLDAGFYLWFKTLNKHFIRFEQNMTEVPQLVPAASGVVLELGPGLGNQLRRFDKSKVTRIIGVENNARFVPDIQQQIQELGLEDTYELITSGVEDGRALERQGLTAGSVDTVLSIQVICSVQDPEATAKDLYRLLKPGGKLIFWEHHRNSDWLTAAVQYLWNPLWRPLIGSCNITRDMKEIIGAAGEWENFDSIKGDEQPWSMLPRVWGILVKARDV